jgi:hypothetical protein
MDRISHEGGMVPGCEWPAVMRGRRESKDYPVVCRNFIPRLAAIQSRLIVFNELHLAIQVHCK